MKTLIIAAIGLLLTAQTVHAQKAQPADYLTSHLPNDLTLDQSAVRSYRMATDYCDFDLTGNFRAKRRLTGTVTYRADSARWNEVYYAESKIQDEAFPPGKKQDFIQDFGYRPGAETLSTDFFKTHLPEATPLVMNMVWDALAFEVLAYGNWDSLKLNHEFRAKNIDSELDIAIGTFENKETSITWIGITKIGDKICAILKYSVMNNPLDVEFEHISMRGRSHYWGEIYVSLADKQIESANLTEDILTDMSIKGQKENVLGYTTRYLTLSIAE